LWIISRNICKGAIGSQKNGCLKIRTLGGGDLNPILDIEIWMIILDLL